MGNNSETINSDEDIANATNINNKKTSNKNPINPKNINSNCRE